jgi:peptide/nickel transport system permease protein
MVQFIFKSIGQRIVLLFFISIISHAIVHLAPGEPSLVDPSNPRMKAEDIQRIRTAFHLDEPLYAQYVDWMKDLFTAELKSFKDNQPVLEKIWDRFLNSLPLFIVGTLITWFLAFPVGIQAALRRGSVFDKVGTFLSYALISIPGFFLSYICIIFMVKTFNVPVIGMRTFGLENAGLMLRSMDRVWHWTLPALMSAVAGVAILSRYVRSQMLEVINQDYIRTARAKGLPENTIIYRHGLRNALLPFITMFGLTIPGLIGGSVIFETIFAWPGMGKLIIDAIQNLDRPIVVAYLMITVLLFVVINLVVDILYSILDPRVRIQDVKS